VPARLLLTLLLFLNNNKTKKEREDETVPVLILYDALYAENIIPEKSKRGMKVRRNLLIPL